jgi:SAM-dependent methyltransferase
VTWTYSEEYYKKYTRDTWNESADEYAPIAANLDLWNEDLMRAASPREGDRALDVATGLGEPAFTLARAVAPRGSVLGIDLAERMVEKGNALARQRGVANLRFEVMDAEKLELPDASFDLVACRFGLQIVTDPDRVLDEMGRVLKPGGRLAATVWGPGERCPALHVIVGPMLKHAEPDETGYLPTPYEMGGEGELVAKLGEHGFVDAREERVTRAWTFASPDAYLHGVLKGTPIGHSLGEEDPPVQEEVLRDTRANLERYRQPDGRIVAPAEAVVVSARKPS